MDTFTRSDLRDLIERGRTKPEFRVSIYMPAHRTGREIREDMLRCKNLRNQALEMLQDAGLRVPDAQSIVAPIRALQEDGLFWQNQSDGLAMFAESSFFARYRVPVVFDELLVVNRRFHLAPMLPLLQGDGRFHLLAVSQRQVRFFEGTKHAISELEVEGLPKNLREALNIDEYVRSIQHQSQTTRGIPGPGEGIFHGHGGSDLDVKKKDEILQYFHRLDHGLQRFFGEERTPLVFAGVDYLFPIFREASSYRRLVDEPVTGSPDELDARELHHQAWKIVEPMFRVEQESALKKFGNLNGKGRSTDLEEVLRAAREGRVETLFVPRGRTIWGRFDEESGALQRLNASVTGAEDLLDRAAVETVSKHGAVFSLDDERMPSDDPIAAVFRYVA